MSKFDVEIDGETCDARLSSLQEAMSYAKGIEVDIVEWKKVDDVWEKHHVKSMVVAEPDTEILQPWD